ncbi:hypothetical protein H311_01053 [Anncaliia algerae PRA109]|nr:hypothetical protein H311_01053 [Anncaliia algerae PRA109]
MRNILVGGPGIVCQIDESCFSHRVKAHMGRVPQNPGWVFGMVDTSKFSKRFYVQVVADRSADTPLPIIARIIRLGSTIHSNKRRSYRGITANRYHHQTVNHSLYLVNPMNGVHT